MKKKMTQILTAILALAVSAALAGCAGGQSASAQQAEASEQTEMEENPVLEGWGNKIVQISQQAFDAGLNMN